jgi:hypothetical protein
MTESTSTRQLLRASQSLLSKALPQWMKHRRQGLLRRTEDFVQWLLIAPSAYEPSFRIHYAIQALAEQFPVEAVTLGDYIRGDNGEELRFTTELLTSEPQSLIAPVIQQVVPASNIELSAKVVGEFLEDRQFDHVSARVAQGIAKAVQGDIQGGRKLFQEAVSWYNRIDTPWAKLNQERIQIWLSNTDSALLNQLKHDATAGASLLRLKR